MLQLWHEDSHCDIKLRHTVLHTLQSIEALKRVETLDAKEKALAAKEAELKRWEADLRATGNLKPKKNWPFRFFAILHHDIAAEVTLPHPPPPPPSHPLPLLRVCMFAEG